MRPYASQSLPVELPHFFPVERFPGPRPPVNYIVLGTARRYEWEGENALSVKLVAGGSARFTTTDTQYLLHPGRLLLLNAMRRYQVTIEARHPVEAISVFFRPGFAEEVAAAYKVPTEMQLVDPQYRRSSRISFYEQVFTSPRAADLIRRMRTYAACGQPESLWLDECMTELMIEMLSLHEQNLGQMETVPVVRQNAKDELFRRLLYARDYMAAMYSQDTQLADVARVACLSPSYFLRAYKAVFGETPHQFLIARRLEVACDQLRDASLTVGEICRNVGFTSLGSFSWMFKQRVGMSPMRYRQASRGPRSRPA